MQEPSEAGTSSPLAGKRVLFTGSLPIPRSEAEALVEGAGGVAAKSASRNVDFVVVGENPGSKAAKARDLGLTIIDFETFQGLLDRA
jgi:DNA ligase (NAD+)